MNVLIVIVGIACNASASLFVKVAMRARPRLDEPLSLVTNAPLWASVVLYLMAFILYAMAIARLPLNVAYPILTSGAIAVVAVLSKVFFGEPLPWTTIAGISLVIAGVYLIAWRLA
jgi:multidrug transporter EmrE-like cation transporter